jgi:hypothetical protein
VVQRDLRSPRQNHSCVCHYYGLCIILIIAASYGQICLMLIHILRIDFFCMYCTVALIEFASSSCLQKFTKKKNRNQKKLDGVR